jgi:hypothetical protein
LDIDLECDENWYYLLQKKIKETDEEYKAYQIYSFGSKQLKRLSQCLPSLELYSGIYFTLNQEFTEAVNDGILIRGSDSSDHFNYVTYYEEAEPYKKEWTMRGIIDFFLTGCNEWDFQQMENGGREWNWLRMVYTIYLYQLILGSVVPIEVVLLMINYAQI